jgi:hypothetical protein
MNTRNVFAYVLLCGHATTVTFPIPRVCLFGFCGEVHLVKYLAWQHLLVRLDFFLRVIQTTAAADRGWSTVMVLVVSDR